MMSNCFEELNKPTDVLVIGNGFDLHCGLKSSFKNFFDSELKNGNQLNVKRIKSNIWYLIFTFAFMLKEDKGGKIVPFVGNDNPLWMDVETYIDKVFRSTKSLPIFDFVNNTLKKEPDMFLSDSDIINGDSKNQPFLMSHRVRYLKNQFKFTSASDLLLHELNIFEKDFAFYLINELKNKKIKYEQEVNKFVLITIDNYATNSFFVLSFNYTRNFGSSVDSDKIINVHGTLDKGNIIIGIGDYENGGLPGRDLFKKSKRRVKDDYGSINLPPIVDIKSVCFYGCSFSKQDWNYYRLLFNFYKLGQSNIVFKFLYSDFCEKKEDNKNNRNKYYNACSETVNKYFVENGMQLKFDDLYNLGKIVFKSVWYLNLNNTRDSSSKKNI